MASGSKKLGLGCMVIVGIAIALLVPAVQNARNAARKTNDKWNLKGLSLAVANYHDVHHCFPPAYIADANGRPMHSWRVLILPFLGDNTASQVYDAYDFDRPWDSPKNSLLTDKRPEIFGLHGGNNEGSHTNYLAVVGKNTAWPFGETTSYTTIPDGTANTIMFVENVGSNIQWTEPRDLNFETMSMTFRDDPVDGISSWLHPPGVAMVDGSTRSLDPETSESELRSMLLINDQIGAGNRASVMKDGRNRPINPRIRPKNPNE